MSWYIDVRHDALGKFRRISGPDRFVIEEKARLQREAWDRQWERMSAAESRRAAREQAIMDRQEKKDLARQRSLEAQEALREIEEVLAHTLAVDDKVDWELLKDKTLFSKSAPTPPKLEPLPPEPLISDSAFQPIYSLWDKLRSSPRQAKIAAAREAFQTAHDQWETVCTATRSRNEEATAQHARVLREWEEERRQFLAQQEEHNRQVDLHRIAYEKADPEAIVDYCDLVLSNSSYPDWVSRDFEVQYLPETNVLVVEYQLPPPDALPTLKEVKYIQTRDALEEVFLPEASRNKLYDSLIYQITLRTLHELYETDTVGVLHAIVFNGWVWSIDRATGKEVNSCIVTVQARKNDFLSINLAQVDPKACFKSLKGVGSSKLHGLAAVAPIMKIDRTDKRFVASHEVAASLDAGTNLAAMDWEEFEHLVRELFEKEFTSSGGEVKVTRASRDGGVDAIAFDPDPIRGGRIVIQAKRYTNTVGVSAVRDLYGTVVNEGATKGILVTTSDYGPDAYEFAKGKPLTLLNGGNLLHLLEKHGHKARIDLREAKERLSDGGH